MTKKLLLLLSVLLLLFISCNDELFPNEVEPDTADVILTTEDYINLINELGYDTFDIIDNGEYFIVEEDIMLLKNELLKMSVSTRHIRSPYIMNDNYRTRIDIALDDVFDIDNGSDFNWRNVVQTAANYWNLAAEGAIKIVNVSQLTPNNQYNPMVRIRTCSWGELPNNKFGIASPPTFDGAPGPEIAININCIYINKFSESQILYNIIHELGHVLGLQHTNWKKLNEQEGVWIIGTSNIGSNPDPNSVMNGNTELNSWKGFSENDKFAIQLLYKVKRNKVIDNMDVIPLFRIHNTSSQNEYNVLGFEELEYCLKTQSGSENRKLTGILGYVMKNSNSKNQPLYRIYNKSTQNDFSVLGEQEKNYWLKVASGYKNRELSGITGYAFTNKQPNTVPLYSIYNKRTKNEFTVVGDEEMHYWLNVADDHKNREYLYQTGWIYKID